MTNESGSIIQVAHDTLVLREGETVPEMYQIIRGHAEIYTGYQTKEEVLLGIIGPQAVFGEFGLLLGRPSVYTVIAYSDLVLLRIGEGSLGSFIRDNQRKAIEIMRNMANTMMIMQQQISLFANELEAGRSPDPKTIKKARRNLRGYAIYSDYQADYEEFRNTFMPGR